MVVRNYTSLSLPAMMTLNPMGVILETGAAALVAGTVSGVPTGLLAGVEVA